MRSTVKLMPPKRAHLERITSLLVSGDCADALACHVLTAHGLRLAHVATVAAAIDHLLLHAPAVILCERDLPDGDWLDVLAACKRLKAEPRLIVLDRSADESLWCRVLELGGFDVLAKPLRDDDAAAAVTSAVRHWYGEVTGLASVPGGDAMSTGARLPI